MTGITKNLAVDLDALTSAILNEKGQEVNNPNPVAFPTDLGRPLTLQQQIQRLLRTEFSRQMQEQGMETFEESDDFDIENDFDKMAPDTKYTVVEEEFPNSPVEPEREPPPQKGAAQANQGEPQSEEAEKPQ